MAIFYKYHIQNNRITRDRDMIPKKEVPDYVLDLKFIRNAVYAIGDGKNPYERDQRFKRACSIAHDITEKWKERSRDHGVG